jgi:hypothetical protein
MFHSGIIPTYTFFQYTFDEPGMEDQTALYEITMTRESEEVLSEQFQTIG